jgi:hypothetical protein
MRSPSPRLWLIPLDYSEPTLQGYLDARGDGPLAPADVQVAAEVLERCVRTSEVLTTFALRLAGRPCQ